MNDKGEIWCDHNIWHPWLDKRVDLVVDHEIADPEGFNLTHECEQVKVFRRPQSIQRIFILKDHAPPPHSTL